MLFILVQISESNIQHQLNHNEPGNIFFRSTSYRNHFAEFFGWFSGKQIQNVIFPHSKQMKKFEFNQKYFTK